MGPGARALVVGGAVVLGAVGCAVLVIALIVTTFACDDAVEQCRPWSLGVLQLAVAVIALVPLGGLIGAAVQDRDSAVGWLLSTIVAYAVWASLASGHL